MSSKFVYFDGKRFTRDDKTGYYLNSTIRKRLHRYVWEFHNGEIPKGHHIHHVDGDKSNNDTSNLVAMPQSEHATLHGLERASEYYEEMIDNLNNNARPKASEWHGSDEGREWHKLHYENTKDKLHERIDMKCDECAESFRGMNNGTTRFCSNACKSKWRRKSGIDNVTRRCGNCNENFECNKYSGNATCSRGCANTLRAKKRKGEIN